MKNKIDLMTEIVAVQSELLFFRGECLPAFLKPGDPLKKWQQAATRLLEFLPFKPDPFHLRREDFIDFLFQSVTRRFNVADGRIIWRIGVFVDVEITEAIQLWGGSYKGTSNPHDVFGWLMSWPVDSTVLFNGLCLVLPAVACVEPALAKVALDPETWRGIVRGNKEITDEERLRQLKFVDGYYFGHVLNNALLHVLGALANNHFFLIGEYLDHPNLRGGYTGLMPHYLFAVLFARCGR